MRDEYEQEIRNLKILLTAAVRSSGGRMVIEDSDIEQIGDDDVLHRFNDSANRCIVLTSNSPICVNFAKERNEKGT